MAELRILRGIDAGPEHLSQAIEIDKLVYEDELQGVEELCLAWFRKNPSIYTFLLDDFTGEVIGYINTMPIKEQLCEDIVLGKIVDSYISEDDILVYEDNTNYSLYFCSIAVHPDYRGTQAFSMLYNAFMKELLHLSERNIYITEVIADGVTARGARMCRLSGLEPVITTNHGSEIYVLPIVPYKFQALSYEGEKLKDVYVRRYNDE